MEAWLSYSLSDFLLFSAETYWRLFERANREQWPMPLAGMGLGLIALLAVLWPRTLLLRLAALMAGALMLWVAYGFLRLLYQPINPAMHLAAPVYGLGGAFLMLFALTGRRAGKDRGSWIPALLIVGATIIHPALASIGARPLAAGEFIGIAPDPTAIMAAAVALMATRLRVRLILLAVPLAWLTWSALTLHTLGTSTWAMPAVAVPIALIGVVRNR